jgi:flagellar biosynthetic protein FlhB
MAEDIPKEEKTEEATPRRRQESREKGNAPFSSELTAGAMLVGIGITLLVGGASFAETGGRLVVGMLEAAGELAYEDFDPEQIARLLQGRARAVLPGFLALILPVFVIGLVVGYGQIGFQLAPKAIAPDPTRLDPIKGLGRMFSMSSVVRLLQAMSKIGLIVLSMGIAAWTDMHKLDVLAGGDLRTTLVAVGSVIAKAAAAALITIVLIALTDLLWQRRKHETEMRMTKQEVKEEFKEIEGDPHVRSRIRTIQREMARRRMMADVPKATVVVTNPTHYAVALLYDRSQEGERPPAPRVVAKGLDLVAENIKQVAREAGVPVYEAPPLARALHARVEIGDEIPEELFQAVAGVLAYVYRLQGEAVPA